jgi:hypothetical protein
VKKKKQTPRSTEEIDQLRANMETLKATLEVIRIAYYNRTLFQGQVPDYEDVRKAAEDFITANHEYQKALWGKVKVKLSVANLLR